MRKLKGRVSRRRGLGQAEAPAAPARTNGKGFPMWSGLPLGAGVTFLSTKALPDFKNIQSDWFYPLPYTLPAVGLGVLMLLSPRFRRAGYGTLLGAGAYYAYAVIWNLASGAEYRRLNK